MKAKFDITVDNVGAIYEFASRLDEKNAIEQCLKFADLNAERLLMKREVFCKLPYGYVTELVTRDTFCVREVDLFTALVSWQQCNKHVELHELLKDVRWNQISAPEFASEIRPFKIISDAQYFKSFESNLPPRVSSSIDSLLDGDDDSVVTAIGNQSGRESLEEGLNEGKMSLNVGFTNSTNESVDVAPKEQRLFDDELQLLKIILKFCEKSEFASQSNGTGAVEIILKVVERKIEERVCDELFIETWISLYSLMVDKENCRTFLACKGVQYIIECFRMFKNRIDLLSRLLVIINVFLEHKEEEFVRPLLVPEVIAKICSLTIDPNVLPAYHYVATYIMLLFTQHRELFDTEVPFCDRKAILQKLTNVIENWPLNRDLDYQLRNFNIMISMAKLNEDLAFKMFAIWSVAYFTRVNSDHYCQMIKVSTVYEVMNDVNSDTLKSFGNKAVFNINEYMAKQVPSFSKERKKKLLKRKKDSESTEAAKSKIALNLDQN